MTVLRKWCNCINIQYQSLQYISHRNISIISVITTPSHQRQHHLILTLAYLYGCLESSIGRRDHHHPMGSSLGQFDDLCHRVFRSGEVGEEMGLDGGLSWSQS